MTDGDIDQFVASLADFRPDGPVFNQYGWDDPTNAVRRSNLALYLRRMRSLQSDTLLVSEAPGYQGCRLTGIPFTSEHTMMGFAGHAKLFAPDVGFATSNYLAASPPRNGSLKKEPSGTIVWSLLAHLDVPPLIWGSFPFHPHIPGLPLSNRAPTRSEVQAGLAYLKRIIEISGVQRIVAVGNKGDEALTRLGIAHMKVRHPSQGGKRDFVAGMSLLYPDWINSE